LSVFLRLKGLLGLNYVAHVRVHVLAVIQRIRGYRLRPGLHVSLRLLVQGLSSLQSAGVIGFRLVGVLLACLNGLLG
jgi:hypothetical protein